MQQISPTKPAATISASPSPGLSSSASNRYDRSTAWFYAGLFVIALLTCALFWETAGVGFLLDDHLHVGYLHDAVLGHPAEMLKRMYSVWSYTTDGLSAYRPGLTLSFWLDYTLWHGQALGMHISNIALTACASVFVALTGSELALAFGLRHRRLTALAAGLLFTVYPLHPEATAWIAGRADVFSSALYILSVWGFLRFSRTRNRAVLFGSLASFLLSLTMKEMPATLPITITLAALFIYPRTKLTHIGAYWLTLAIFAAWRSSVIGQVVGGYGDVSDFSILQIIRNYADKETFLKLLFGATQEFPSPGYLPLANYISLGFISLLALASALSNKRISKLFGFLICWCAATLIPAFQIWHIYPNLVGSRIFWIGSAPLCLLVAFAAASGRENLPPWLNRLAQPLGIGALACLLFGWSYILQINLSPWVVAGQQMCQLKEQAQALAAKTPIEQRVLLVNIPQDYHGVPMLGRPEFLEELCRPPFFDRDIANRVLTAQRPISGGHEYIFPELLGQLRSLCTSSYIWNETIGSYLPLKHSGWNQPLALTFDASLVQRCQWQPQPSFSNGNTWNILSDSTATIEKDGVELHIGRQGLDCWLPCQSIDPAKLSCVELETTYSTGFDSNGGKAPVLQWQSTDGLATSTIHTIEACAFHDGKFTFLPSRLKSWTLSNEITKLGFHFPAGDYFVKLKVAAIVSHSRLEPSTSVSLPMNALSSGDKARSTWSTSVSPSSRISWDAQETPNTEGVRIYISKSWQPLADLGTSAAPMPKTISYTTDIAAVTGEIQLPAAVLQQTGAHELVVLPVNKKGEPVGIFSEPRSILVP